MNRLAAATIAALLTAPAAGAQMQPASMFAPLSGAGSQLELPAAAVSVAPDGKHVYSVAPGRLDLLARDSQTGLLSLVACLSTDGSGAVAGEPGCVPAAGLRGASAVAVSSDGRWVFVTATELGSVAAFRRDPAGGGLTPAGCVAERASFGAPCAIGHVFLGADTLALTADGRRVLVGSGQRNSVSTLALAQAPPAFGVAGASGSPPPPLGNPCIARRGADNGCVNSDALGAVDALAATPDGTMVYAATADGGVHQLRIDQFDGALSEASCLLRGAAAAGCAGSPSLTPLRGLALSSDGRQLYGVGRVDALSSVTTLIRDTASGALSFGACMESSAARGCTGAGGELGALAAIVATPDPATLYAAGPSTIDVLRRDPQSGALALTSHCCVEQFDFEGVARSPDARQLYIATGERLLVAGAGAQIGPPAPNASPSGRVALALRCPRAAHPRCAGRLELLRRGRVARVASGATFSLAPGAARRIAVRLPRALVPAHGRRVALMARVVPVRGGGGATGAALDVRGR